MSSTLFSLKFDRVLAAFVGGGFLLLGLAELVFRLDDPMPLLFWLPTLWGGSALVLLGSFRSRARVGISKAMVIIGAALGLLPTAWTLLLPVLIGILAVRAAMSPGAPTAGPSRTGWS
jgi:hypothetical protein